MDIGGWLRELGLGQYEAAFRDNAVDGAILPKLTADDLKEIGVVAVGHRRRLLDAIAALWATLPASPAPGPAARGPDLAGGLRFDRIRRASSDHGDVLRPRRLDFARGEARSRGLAQSGRGLSRRRLGRRDFARRPCAEEARRRADGAVRLSPGAGERRRARRARGARDPARARRPQRAQRRDRRAGARRPHRARERAGRGRFDRRGLWRGAQRRRARAERRRARRNLDHAAACTGRSRACSSPRTRASTN